MDGVYVELENSKDFNIQTLILRCIELRRDRNKIILQLYMWSRLRSIHSMRMSSESSRVAARFDVYLLDTRAKLKGHGVILTNPIPFISKWSNDQNLLLSDHYNLRHKFMQKKVIYIIIRNVYLPQVNIS